MSDTPPLISIIIPVYKVEPYLRQCLDSVLAQTYPHWEAICINDGSPDNCGAILDEYAAKDSRFIVIHQENQGVSVARNKGLEIMQGKYLTFLDSDDWFSPNALECIIEAMETTNADYGRCSYIYHYKNKPSKPHLVGSLFYKSNILYTTHSLCVQDRKSFTPNAGGAIYKTSIIKKQKILFSPYVKIGEDLEYNLNYLQYVHTITYLYTPIYHYNIQTGICNKLITQTAKMSKKEISYTISAISKLTSKNPTKKERQELQGFYAIQLLSIINQCKDVSLMDENITPKQIFPWKYIFSTLPYRNLIDTIKLIIHNLL